MSFGFIGGGRMRLGAAAVAACLFGALFWPGMAGADGAHHTSNMADWLRGRPGNPTDHWRMALGGRLYDNWAGAQGVELPGVTHPQYPKTGKRSGGGTWRCKECHGWDTNGADGAYRSGSHYTGIRGLRGLRDAEPAAIAASVRGHGFTAAMIPDDLLDALALFVSKGQIETETYVDYPTRRVKGSADKGAPWFQNICAVCHGFDGRAINFDPGEEPEYVGTVALKAPWELFHKLRNGHPGQAMVVLGMLPLETLADIAAYAQTLPAE
jgi:thiosulfate dehydrogenase